MADKPPVVALIKMVRRIQQSDEAFDTILGWKLI